ncbi:PTS transporter subunit EIIB [Lacticaseibacillus casei]|nr:PTS transporter subunit EIIB [Lacticaseibacillus casei]
MTVQHNFRNIADSYIEALGGKANIESLVNCATRI